MNIVDIYHAIMRLSGITIKTIETQGAQSETKAGISTKFKAVIPLFGSGEAKASGELSAGSSKEKTFEEVPVNLELPQDVSELLKRAGRTTTRVILENFHYLDDEKQGQLAFDLRTFQEIGVQFVILGVWREKNRLAQFNGDLLDRIIEVPVEPWTRPEFIAVAQSGERFLNIVFSETMLNAVIDASFSSIGVFQELLKEVCKTGDITETQKEIKTICDLKLLEKACLKKAEEYSARHQRALEALSAGNLSASAKEGIIPLYLPYYLVQVILEEGYDVIATGINRSIIQEKIQTKHHRPQDVRASDMSNLLHNLAKTQANKSITPPIIDYDQSKKMLQIVDSTFYFFLKHANLKTIAKELPNPIEQ